MTAEATFPNKKAVHEHLVKAGYKRGRSTVYKDAEEGRLRATGKKGVYTKKDVDRYIKDVGLTLPDEVNNDSHVEERQKAEAKLKAQQAEMMELRVKERAGELVPRTWFVQELGKRALVFKQDLKNLATAVAPEIVKVVDGDTGKTPDVIEVLERKFAETLNRYAKPDAKFQVPKAVEAE